MGAFPGREFRMVQIVREVTHARAMNLKERRTARKAVIRVLAMLIESGSVTTRPEEPKRGAPTFYTWKVRHGVIAE